MRIFLIRHGESLGDVDQENYEKIHDHQLPITEWGYQQSQEAAQKIKAYYANTPELAGRKLRIIHSPFLRTEQTAKGMKTVLGDNFISNIEQNFLLQEQDFGIFNNIPDPDKQKQLFPHEWQRNESQRQNQGKFYARPPMGESRSDTAHRALTFKNNLIDLNDLHDNEDIIIVGHGVINRALEMVFTKQDVAWFEGTKNPENTDITMLEGNKEKGFTSSTFHTGKLRPKNLPKDYMSKEYGLTETEQINR